jgi:hypothetical protein
MSEAKWINKGAFYALRVSTLGPRITFEDLVEDDTIHVYVDHTHPFLTGFVTGLGETLEPCFDVTRGSGLTERRVIHYTNRSTHRRLRVGLTIHQSVFSSLPHPFEKDPVPGFEEAFYMVGGKTLVEMQGLMGTDYVDTAVACRGGDLVAVPMGWHRVVALPDDDGNPTPLAYIWAYLAKRTEWEKDNDHT